MIRLCPLQAVDSGRRGVAARLLGDTLPDFTHTEMARPVNLCRSYPQNG